MELNFIGLVAGLSTFVGVWFGHVAVRKVEAVSVTVWLPMTLFAIAGVGFELLALSASSPKLSAACGILGITLLWDALEFIRQQHRIRKGHAPANPGNPRHARLMSEHPGMTTLDLLKREPAGEAVSYSEAIDLIVRHG